MLRCADGLPLVNPRLGRGLSRLILALLMPGVAGAQDTATALPVSVVHWASGPLKLDGIPMETAWFQTDSIVDFIQKEPNEGEPVTMRTVVRILAAPDGLHIAFWGYDSLPSTIRHAQLRRDADFSSDDNFSVMFDATHDFRAGYIFSVNPNGALYDGEVISFESVNTAWDGIWNARARITKEGWTAELVIPWQTLRYPLNGQPWGANFRRVIRRTNETALWSAWHRSEGLTFLQREGILEGMTGLPRRQIAEVRPYAAVTAAVPERMYDVAGNDTVIHSATVEPRVGGDVKFAVAPTLALDVTLNTDFAQAEVDRQVINLTRFPVFFPETRQFFLEGAGIFDFGRPERTQLFYTRRIGLSDSGTVVPMLAGARLQGRAGHQRIGLLGAVTGGDEDAVDVVASIQRDALGRGFVGAMGTLQAQGGHDSWGAGADFYLPLIVQQNQNLVFSGYSMWSINDSIGTGSAQRIFIDYPNDAADCNLTFDRIAGNFDPALGFVRQAGIYRGTGQAEFFPRPQDFLNIRKFDFVPLAADVTWDLGGRLDNGLIEIRPLGAEFQSEDFFEVNLQRWWDNPTEAFVIFPGVIVPAGNYTFDRLELNVFTSPGRPVSIEASISAGGFFDGHSTSFSAGVSGRIEPHVILGLDVEHSRVTRAAGSFSADLLRVRADVAMTPRWSHTLFVQFDNESSRIGVNYRMRYSPFPGSDLFIVWNNVWPTGLPGGIPFAQPTTGALVVKYVYYHRV